jgi:hypothetical protein
MLQLNNTQLKVHDVLQGKILPGVIIVQQDVISPIYFRALLI